MENLIALANVSEGTFVHRPMTENELLADEANRAAIATLEAEETKKAAKAAAAKAALLEKLGITEEEAKLLLS